jgi:hypothetical protein
METDFSNGKSGVRGSGGGDVPVPFLVASKIRFPRHVPGLFLVGNSAAGSVLCHLGHGQVGLTWASPPTTYRPPNGHGRSISRGVAFIFVRHWNTIFHYSMPLTCHPAASFSGIVSRGAFSFCVCSGTNQSTDSAESRCSPTISFLQCRKYLSHTIYVLYLVCRRAVPRHRYYS